MFEKIGSWYQENMIEKEVGQTLDQGNLNFTFPQLQASSGTQIRYTGSGFTQNQLPNFQNCLQNSGNSYGMNPQGTFGPNHHFGQPMQQDQFAYNHHQQQQQQQNPCAQNPHSLSGNPCICPAPGIAQSNSIPCGNYLPQNIIDQIRNCGGNTAPIFILPNSQPTVQPQQFPQNPSPQIPSNIGYPSGIGIGYPSINSNPIFSPPSCYPIPVPIIPFCNSMISGNHQTHRSQLERNSNLCDCCRRNNTVGNNSGQIRNSGNFQSSNSAEENDQAHRCNPGSDDTVCTKANCPASISLQALVSQLLSLQGVIPCAATRLILRKIPGSNVSTTVEDTMDRAQKCISSLNKEQLITEARNAQQVNGLINLHMMQANPPQSIIPILTMLQLKVNSLKAIVENLVNKGISECQSVGVDGNTALEPMLLSMKSDADIRELLATLRQKECEERVNVNYAPYHSQKVVAESRLANFQNKINQVEAEIERRRACAMPWAHFNGQFNHQTAFSQEQNYRPSNIHESHFNGSQGFWQTQSNDFGNKAFDSPSPFAVQVQNPRRLNLRPNVGGSQTTYCGSSEDQNPTFPMKESRERSETKKSCFKDKESTEPSKEADDPVKGVTEGKKKLKIHIDGKGELSVTKKSLEEFNAGEFVQSTPEVVFVIDDDKVEKELRDEKKNTKKLKKIKNVKKKSEESIPSDSTYDSETSVSSRSSDAEDIEKEEKGYEKKSVLKNILKGKKKTTNAEKVDKKKRGNHDSPEPMDEGNDKMIKKEKHVDVIANMLAELCYDKFIPRNYVNSFKSEFVPVLDSLGGSEENSESSSIENNENDHLHLCKYQEDEGSAHRNDPEISVTLESGASSTAEICFMGENTSGESILSFVPKFRTKKDSKIEGICTERMSTESVLKEMQNRSIDLNDIRSPMVSSIEERKEERIKKEKIKRRENKENSSQDLRSCSILEKKKQNKDNQILKDSFSGSMDKDLLKKRFYRFK